MNDMRKLMEAIEEVNEVSDFDGPVDNLITQFQDTCKEIGICDDPVKKKELMQVVLARSEEFYSTDDNPIEEGGYSTKHSDQKKSAFIAGWEWALATDWNHQLDSEAGYVNWASGKPKPENY